MLMTRHDKTNKIINVFLVEFGDILTENIFKYIKLMECKFRTRIRRDDQHKQMQARKVACRVKTDTTTTTTTLRVLVGVTRSMLIIGCIDC